MIRIELRPHIGEIRTGNDKGKLVAHQQYIVLAVVDDYFGTRQQDGTLTPRQIGYIGNWSGADFVPINEFRRLPQADQPAIREAIAAALEDTLSGATVPKSAASDESTAIPGSRVARPGADTPAKLDSLGDADLSSKPANRLW